MLLAFGAASAALDAIKSLTSSKPTSSQPIGSGPASGGPFDVSAPPSGGSTAVTGFSGGPQISPDTLGALLDAQSQSSTGLHAHVGGSNGPSANQLLQAPTTSSSAASSSYNVADQLIQRETRAISFSAPALSVNV